MGSTIGFLFPSLENHRERAGKIFCNSLVDEYPRIQSHEIKGAHQTIAARGSCQERREHSKRSLRSSPR